jgi:hypothetical protein
MTTAPLAINSPLSLETLCKVAQSQIDAMSFSELDGFVDLGIDCIALNQASIIQARQTMAPAIVRIHDALTEDSQGRRTDLMEHPPITWTTWCHNKQRLGCKRTLDALVKSAKLKLPSNVKFLTGDVAVDKGTGDEAEVVFVHETAEKIDVRYKGETEVKTVPVSDFTKPKKKPSVKLPKIGDIISERMEIIVDNGGKGKYETRSFEIAGTETVENAISMGSFVKRPSRAQLKEGFKAGDIYLTIRVREVKKAKSAPKPKPAPKKGRQPKRGRRLADLTDREPKTVVHIAKRCGGDGKSWKPLCGATGCGLVLRGLKPKSFMMGGEVVIPDPTVPNCPACFAKREANKVRKTHAIDVKGTKTQWSDCFNKGRTYCSKDPEGLLIAAKGEEPTCEACQRWMPRHHVPYIQNPDNPAEWIPSENYIERNNQ